MKCKPCLISVAIALCAGSLAAFLVRDNIRLYAVLNKPPLAPPALLFPVVWTVLYILMGIGQRPHLPAEASIFL